MTVQASDLKLFFDGGCRPNPGMMETAVVARSITYYRDDIGIGTHNDAEWLALIDALYVAESLGAADIVLVGDSALVVNQARGLWKCRNKALRGHLDVFQALAAPFDRVRIRYIRRSQNLAGIALAKRYR